MPFQAFNFMESFRGEVTFTAIGATNHWYILNYKHFLSLAIRSGDPADSRPLLPTNITFHSSTPIFLEHINCHYDQFSSCSEFYYYLQVFSTHCFSIDTIFPFSCIKIFLALQNTATQNTVFLNPEYLIHPRSFAPLREASRCMNDGVLLPVHGFESDHT